jgi:hypothetical protein
MTAAAPPEAPRDSLLRSHGLRRKPAVTRPGDAWERHADALADRALRGPAPHHARRPAGVPPELRRQAAITEERREEEEEPKLARQAATTRDRREDDEEKKLARQAAAPAGGGDGGAVGAAVAAARAPGRALAPEQRSFFEPRLGHDLSGVRVHTDAAAGEAARGIDAHAYTYGSDVVFAPGRYSPSTTGGTRLLAHELAHVVHQPHGPAPLARQAATAPAASPPPAPAPSAPAVAPPTPAAAGPIAAPPGVPAEAVELKGEPTFNPPTAVADYLKQQPKAAPVRVQFGSLAAGVIHVGRRGEVYNTPSGRPQQLPLTHPGLGPIAAVAKPVLAVQVERGAVSGFVSLAEEKRAPSVRSLEKFIEKNPAAMGWLGLDQLQLSKVTNKLETGTLRFGVSNLRFQLGGYLQGSGNLLLENDIVTFNASAAVKVKGLAEGDLKIVRDPLGRLEGKLDVAVTYGKFSGNVHVAYLNGIVDAQGKIRYETEKLTGTVILLVTDAATARDVAMGKLPPDAIRPTSRELADRPEGGAPVAGPRALAGFGELDFRFSDWLTGKAQVIVDGDGDVTVVGEIAPPKSVELFAQRDARKSLPKLEARAAYGLPVIGNVFVFASVEISTVGKLGPGTLYDVRVEGIYSTKPEVFNRFSVSGRLNISAYAGLEVGAKGGVGIRIAKHDIKAGVGLDAVAGIKGYAEATPTLAYREIEDPAAGRKGEFSLRGHLELAAQPFLGLAGNLFVELDSPWWSPAPDKTWTWPLGELEYVLPGEFGIGADIAYVIGSGTLPEISFGSVDFSAEKFMTDLLEDHVPPKRSGDEQKKGTWKEAPPLEEPTATPPAPAGPAAAPKAVPGAAPAKPPPRPAARRRDGAVDGVPGPEVQERWSRGVEAIGELAQQSRKDPYNDAEIAAAMGRLQREYGFTRLIAVRRGTAWHAVASMNPRDVEVPADIVAEPAPAAAPEAAPAAGTQAAAAPPPALEPVKVEEQIEVLHATAWYPAEVTEILEGDRFKYLATPLKTAATYTGSLNRADFGKRWRRYVPGRSLKTGARWLAIRDRPSPWDSAADARQVLNWRRTGGWLNPRGVQWHHIWEDDSDGPHSDTNLMLITGKLNQDLNVFYGREPSPIDGLGTMSLRNWLRMKNDEKLHTLYGRIALERFKTRIVPRYAPAERNGALYQEGGPL